MRLIILQFVLLSLVLFSCKTEVKYPNINNAQAKVDQDRSRENVDKLMKAIIGEYERTNDKKEKLSLLEMGMNVAKEHNLEGQLNSLRLGVITEDPKSESTGKMLIEMATDVKSKGNSVIADIMFWGVSKEHPSLAESAAKLMTNKGFDPDTLILETGQNIFYKDKPGEINKGEARKFVDLCEAYALAHPSSDNAIEYLFKGAEMARSLKSYKKALSLYDMIIVKYPKSQKAASALFVKGFMMENDFRNIEEAKKLYLKFIEDYPNDALAKDVEVLLNNLGKSDEELYNSVVK